MARTQKQQKHMHVLSDLALAVMVMLRTELCLALCILNRHYVCICWRQPQNLHHVAVRIPLPVQ